MRVENGVIQETVEAGRAPIECPSCGSADIVRESDLAVDGHSAEQSTQCRVCKYTWVDIYTFCCSQVAEEEDGAEKTDDRRLPMPFLRALFPLETSRKDRGLCPTCGAKVSENAFRDSLSLREFRISGACQKCQDATFTEDTQ